MIYYVALVLKKWDSIETNIGFSLASKMDDGSIGYLPVFDTEDEAKAAYPDHVITQIFSSKDGQL